MITLEITTSTRTQTYFLDLPVTDKIELHYAECGFCDGTICPSTIAGGST